MILLIINSFHQPVGKIGSFCRKEIDISQLQVIMSTVMQAGLENDIIH